MIHLKIPGKDSKAPVEFYTVSEMAELCGRSKHAFLKLVDRGLMPDTNYRTEEVSIQRGERAGSTTEGTRLYSKEVLAPRLVEIFKKIKQGKKITIEQRQMMMEAFAEEKTFFTKKY